MAAVSLFWNTNMAAMTSRENGLRTGFGFILVQFKLNKARLAYEQSLFILSPSSKTHETQMTTRVTEGARWERHLVFRISPLHARALVYS